MCVCVLGAGWEPGGMELRVGSNVMIFSLCSIYCRVSYGTCTSFFSFLFLYIYICIVSSYICINFMNIITFDYFVFNEKMLESVVNGSEFVYIRK